MKPLLIVMFFLASCTNHTNQIGHSFTRNLPDTTRTWAGKMTKASYVSTRDFEVGLGLKSLLNGVPNTEIRVWTLSDFYDPQVLFILKNDSAAIWHLRTISFFKNKNDSIYTDFTKLIRQSTVDTIKLNRYWTLPSQSDLKAGDSFGCIDGADLFIELADSTRYRFMWYRCPDINTDKDSCFRMAYELGNRLDALGVGIEH